jgi:hypothetical protein
MVAVLHVMAVRVDMAVWKLCTNLVRKSLVTISKGGETPIYQRSAPKPGKSCLITAHAEYVSSRSRFASVCKPFHTIGALSV